MFHSRCAAVPSSSVRRVGLTTATSCLVPSDPDVSPQAWIRSATVRANILCGMDFDAEWYARVVDACALLPDFKQLPAADFTGA